MKVKLLLGSVFVFLLFVKMACPHDCGLDESNMEPSSWRTNVEKITTSSATWKDVSTALKAVNERQTSATDRIYAK